MNPSPSTNGRILQINISPGGVPKRAIPAGEVASLGILGDAHTDPVHHGGEIAALCLFSLERIQALQAEGHPIFPGAAGENLTLSGLDWDLLIPGTRLRLGDIVEIEISKYTTPCSTIAAFFKDEAIQRISQKHYPGWSRVYARVLTGGAIQPGMPVTILP